MPNAPTEPFRTIEDLARHCGYLCWLETGLFEVTGQWAGGDAPAEWRLFYSVTSGQHAALAAAWQARLPVRAGVDAAALVAPPATTTGTLVEGLDHRSAADGVARLVEDVLPSLVADYGVLLTGAAPVREAPVMAVLTRAMAMHAAAMERGRALLT